MSNGNRGPVPGYLGKPQRTISFPFEDLQEYAEMAKEGIIEMSFPAFIRQAFKHELARYRATKKQRRKKE